MNKAPAIYLERLSRNEQYRPRREAPWTMPVFAQLERLDFSAPVTFLVGDNGCGKSTLLEAIAVGLEAVPAGAHSLRDDDTMATARVLAAGLRFGRAAEDEFSDEVVNHPDMGALRRKVVATVDDTIDEASADVTAVLQGGRREHVFVRHAIGSLQNPMTDAQLEAKFHGLSDALLGPDRSDRLIRACWSLGDAADLRALVALATPVAAAA